MLSNKIIIYLLFFLIVPVISLAQDFNVEITSSNAVAICNSETVLLTAKVTNLASDVRGFTINLDGSASSFSTAVPFGLILKPGESKNVYIYVTPSSRVNPSNYDLNLIVSSDQEIKKVGYSITVKNCYNVNIIGTGDKEVCSCTRGTYDVTIENIGEFDDVYDISVNGNARNWVELSQNVVSLKKGGSKTITAYVNFPCGVKGEYTFTINLNSRISNNVASVDFPINVIGCFDYNAYTNKDYVSLCENSAENLILSILNNGNQGNSYTLNIDGPSWIYLENKVINVDASQEGKVNLIVKPGYGVEGNFDVKLKILSEKGEIEKEKIIKVNVKKCHSVIVDVLQERGKICSGLSNVYDVIIKNNGEFSKDYKLASDVEWSNLDKYDIKLNAGEEEKVSLNINAINVSIGKYKIQVGAIALDDSKVSDRDDIEIEIVSLKECYKTIITSNDIKVNVDSSATLPILIENRGNLKNKYLLDISGTASGFVKLNPAIVEIDAGKSETVYLYIAPPINVKEDSYSLTITTKLEDESIIASEDINIEVKSKVKDVKEKFENESLWQRIKNFFKGNVTNVSVEEKPKVKEEVNATKINLGEEFSNYKYYIIGGIIIIIILIILLTRKKESVEEEIEKEAQKVKREIEEEKEEIKEEEFKGGGLWSYILGIVIIALIIFFIWKYFEHIDVYKYYILAGLVILLILILIIRYWKGIVNFFEEEIEEEPEEKKEEIKEKEEEKEGSKIKKKKLKRK